MTHTLAPRSKTIAGQAILLAAVLTMGVGAAVASGPDDPVPNPAEGTEEVAPAGDGSSGETTPVEVPEWKGIKSKGRAGWHALRDENQTEWRLAKVAFDEQCGTDPSDPEDSGESAESAELSVECQALEAELKLLKETGKAEWKAARDQAKAEWKAAKDEAKAERSAAREAAKAERSAAREAAKAERD